MGQTQASPFEATSDGKLRWAGRETRCVLGRSGAKIAENKREGDGATPLGQWPMRQVFYRSDRLPKPETRLPLTALAPHMGWCDDPGHPLYNKQIALPFPASHERLWRGDHIYDLIVVLGYNDAPPIPDKGSAIFLHLARPDFSPTEGCIACAPPDLLALLREARPGDALAVVDAKQQRKSTDATPPANKQL